MGNFCSDCYAKEDNKKAELVEDPPESITTMSSSIVSYSPITTIPSPIVSSSPNLKVAMPESPKIEDIWDDEDWHDALQEHDESFLLSTVYDVCPEELAVLKAELKSQFPNDCGYFSDAYLLSVASKPYSKDMSIRRPLDVRVVECLFTSACVCTVLC